jgi:phage protein U
MQQETGRASYENWWSSVEAVELHSAEGVDGQRQVELDLTYFFADGTAQRETQLLTLERSDGEWLIADDEVLSSRSA